MNAMLILDDREHDLIDRLKSEGVDFEVKRLDIGDIQIENNGCLALIERKRTDDFASSISDGRWREQKSRLISSGAIVIYLIEGSLYGQSVKPEILSSAIWNTMLRDKLWVIQTRGIEDTSMHVMQLVKKIGTQIQSSSGVRSLLSKRKRKEDSVFLLMLMQLTSEKVARAIVSRWPTLLLLQEQLRKDKNVLKTVSISDKRCIGNATIKKLTNIFI